MKQHQRDPAAAQQRNSSGPATTARRVRITFTTSPAVVEHLQSLVSLGLYGATVAEVAERIVCEGLRKDLLAAKKIHEL